MLLFTDTVYMIYLIRGPTIKLVSVGPNRNSVQPWSYWSLQLRTHQKRQGLCTKSDLSMYEEEWNKSNPDNV